MESLDFKGSVSRLGRLIEALYVKPKPKLDEDQILRLENKEREEIKKTLTNTQEDYSRSDNETGVGEKPGSPVLQPTSSDELDGTSKEEKNRTLTLTLILTLILILIGGEKAENES